MTQTTRKPAPRILLALLFACVTALAVAQPGEHTLNLKDADIRVLIGTVSEITGKAFIIDPAVEGKVNVVSSKPMNADEVYKVFESVLRVHGYAAVPAGSMIKIVPEAKAKQDGDNTQTSTGPDAMISRVIELKHVAAGELLPILAPLVPQSSQLSVHASSNSLIVLDRAANVARIEAIVRRIDTASDASVEVLPLEHANATDLARTLTLLMGEDKAAAINGSAQGKVFADGRTNSLLISGDRAARLRLRTLVSHLDTPLQSGEGTQVIYVRYAKAEDLVTILEASAQTMTDSSGAKDQPKAATIQAHGETNALVITADPAVFRALAAIVRQLDVRRAQVMIEGVIAEVSDDWIDEVGIQWFTAPQRGDGTIGQGIVGGTSFPGSNNQPGILGTAVNPLNLGTGLSLGYVDGTIKIPGTDDEILNLGGLLRALKGDARSNILSQPKIVTLDNQEAQFKVGQEVPFLTGQYTNTSTNGGSNQPTNPFQTIDRKDVGLTLTVTPHINEGDTVRLDIKQEVSSLAPNVQGATDLITNKREIDTSVMVGDGQMLVLGGLVSDEVKQNVSKVPALGDIPVVGNLFRYRSNTRTKRDLMIFLRPTILRDAVTEYSVSNEKYNYMRARELEARTRPGYLREDTNQPLLPESMGPAPAGDAQAVEQTPQQ
jgi:general secretion pathway protein D